MTPELLARYDVRVPRYTSYPTAPHFHAGVGVRHYAEALTTLSPAAPLSIYIHVPFCEKLCWYCGCNTKIVARYAPVAAFRDLIEREMASVAARLPGRFAASHIHWGGGTPNILAPEHFVALSDALARHFDRAATCEMAVEIDPRTLTAEHVAALRTAGATRVSLGVQDFAPEVQRAVNRVQPYEVVAAAVDALRAAGIDEINFDLMYGLPLQSEASVVETVDRAVRLAPQRFAVFGYAHVPWLKRHQRLLDRHRLPDTMTRWRLAEALAERLIAHGYRPIGLDHFARPDDLLATAAREGRLRRNFQGYTTDHAETLIGFGPSAIGALPGLYAQNAVDIRRWREAIAAGELAVVRGIALTADDVLRRAVIERIMCEDVIDLAAIARRFGHRRPPFERERAKLAVLVADGLIHRDGHVIRLTELGRRLRRAVAAVFDRYLQEGEVRHAKAV